MLGDSLIGRTMVSGTISWGSNPCPPANVVETRKRPTVAAVGLFLVLIVYFILRYDTAVGDALFDERVQ